MQTLAAAASSVSLGITEPTEASQDITNYWMEYCAANENARSLCSGADILKKKSMNSLLKYYILISGDVTSSSLSKNLRSVHSAFRKVPLKT